MFIRTIYTKINRKVTCFGLVEKLENLEERKECKVCDVTMFYADVVTGYPLLLLHGLPVDHCHIANDIESLFTNRNEWRRLYPHLPGMGKTKATARLTNQDQILEFDLVTDKRKEVRRG